MKLIIQILFFLFFINCNFDDFHETIRIIETDRNEYEVGDTIELTLKIIPKDSRVKMKVYENYKNLEISFSLINSLDKVQNEQWSERSGKNLSSVNKDFYLITKEKPFERTFLVPISSKKEKIVLEIPELNLIAEYDKNRIQKDSIRIHGFYDPIDPVFLDALEDYFEVKDIKINVVESE
ncbi:MAG TPA: hypothetical protein VL022_01500 [Moheibacter sp.]|nr:hypothetical protein [Moheibacter sp.]